MGGRKIIIFNSSTCVRNGAGARYPNTPSARRFSLPRCRCAGLGVRGDGDTDERLRDSAARFLARQAGAVATGPGAVGGLRCRLREAGAPPHRAARRRRDLTAPHGRSCCDAIEGGAGRGGELPKITHCGGARCGAAPGLALSGGGRPAPRPPGERRGRGGSARPVGPFLAGRGTEPAATPAVSGLVSSAPGGARSGAARVPRPCPASVRARGVLQGEGAARCATGPARPGGGAAAARGEGSERLFARNRVPWYVVCATGWVLEWVFYFFLLDIGMNPAVSRREGRDERRYSAEQLKRARGNTKITWLL